MGAAYGAHLGERHPAFDLQLRWQHLSASGMAISCHPLPCCRFLTASCPCLYPYSSCCSALLNKDTWQILARRTNRSLHVAPAPQWIKATSSWNCPSASGGEKKKNTVKMEFLKMVFSLKIFFEAWDNTPVFGACQANILPQGLIPNPCSPSSRVCHFQIAARHLNV